MEPAERKAMTVLLDAAEDLVVAGQQTILDRIELVRYEATQDIQSVLQAATRAAAAAFLATIGWALLVFGGVAALSRIIDPGLAALVIGAPHLLAALVLARSTSPAPPPERLHTEAVDA